MTSTTAAAEERERRNMRRKLARPGRGESRSGEMEKDKVDEGGGSQRELWTDGYSENLPARPAGSLTLVQLVLLHDVVLQLRGQFLFLLLDGRRLPAVLLVHLQAVSTAADGRHTVRVNVVAHDGRLNQLRGGVRRRLAPWTHKTTLFQVGAVEGLHLIDLVGQVNVSVESRLRHDEIGLLVFHLVVIIGDAVGWRT